MIDENLSGKVIAEFEFPISAGKIKEFSKAIKAENPLYIDEKHAKSEGYPGALMPPTFLVTFPFHIPMADAVMDTMKILGMNEKTSIHGEATFENYRPIYSGEKLICKMRIGNIYRKEKPEGKAMTFVEILFEYFDKKGAPAAKITNLFIEKS